MTYDGADRHMTTTVGTSKVTYVRDATDRIVERKLGTTTTSKYGHTGPGDNAGYLMNSGTTVTDRYITLIGGATYNKRTTSLWSYPNIHGDTLATASQAGAKTGNTYHYDPAGQAITTLVDNENGNTDRSWLGQFGRLHEHEGTAINTIEMGARQYVMGLGRFLSADPVNGGSCNSYEYACGDPGNQTDISGTRCRKWTANGDLCLNNSFRDAVTRKYISYTGRVTKWGSWGDVTDDPMSRLNGCGGIIVGLCYEHVGYRERSITVERTYSTGEKYQITYTQRQSVYKFGNGWVLGISPFDIPWKNQETYYDSLWVREISRTRIN